MNFDSNLESIKGVGPGVATKLKILGLKTAGDLIEFFPRRYDDYSQVTSIMKIVPGNVVSIKAVIKQAKGRYVRRGMHITEALASDSSGSMRLVWFNQPYREGSIKAGAEYFITGSFELSRGRLTIMNPSMELVSDFPINTARIVPVYKQTKGLKSGVLRKIMANIKPSLDSLPEVLPQKIIDSNNIISRSVAMSQMHFPASQKDIDEAKKRLSFEELFGITLASLLNKQQFAKESGVHIKFNENLAKDFTNSLPYKLTNAQRKVIWQIYKDFDPNLRISSVLESVSVKSGSTDQAVEDYGEGSNGLIEPKVTKKLAESNASHLSRVADRGEMAPMNRLVEGDVGSGKTVVAVMAGIMAMKAGYQVAFMAPTELLARQHAENITKLLGETEFSGQVALLVSSIKTSAKKLVYAKIKEGEIKLIVGTHALITDKVDLHNLGLVVIDEQHRFGVDQRKALMQKANSSKTIGLDAAQGSKEERARRTKGTASKRLTPADEAMRQEHLQGSGSARSSASETNEFWMPHVLSMTATPIPRSLALTLYGEMDVSILDEMPPGRIPVETKIVSPNSKAQMYKKIEDQLIAGNQVFVVCPLIEESDKIDVLSAEKVYEDLSKKVFKNYKVELLHGRQKSDTKEDTMALFVAGKIDVLVSTTVIEVGVDVPNATVMVIEGVERFGLAQVHQLRGRVGRGTDKGYCYLVMSDSKAPTRRLRALESTTDGFKLAELDLEIRGPGAIYGHMQSGELDLRVANLTDLRQIASIRKSAQDFLDSGDDLKKYPELAKRIQKYRSITNLN